MKPRLKPKTSRSKGVLHAVRCDGQLSLDRKIAGNNLEAQMSHRQRDQRYEMLQTLRSQNLLMLQQL